MKGMMVQMDGSHHKWVGESEWCLINAIDDATSTLLAARFFKSETTLGCLQILLDIAEHYGLPESFYIDRANWGGGRQGQMFAHFEEACKQLDINIIYANSPQAKGRIERANRTHQDRLIPLLKLKKISTMQDANRFLKKTYIPEWNIKFTVAPTLQENRYRDTPQRPVLRETICTKQEREVRADSSISFANVIIEVKQQNGFGLGKGVRVEVRQYPDQTWQIYYHSEPLKLRLAPRNRQPDHRYLEKLPPGNHELDLQAEKLLNRTISLNS